MVVKLVKKYFRYIVYLPTYLQLYTILNVCNLCGCGEYDLSLESICNIDNIYLFYLSIYNIFVRTKILPNQN